MVHFIPTGQRKLALLAAQADSTPALIVGSSGSGKGAIAKWVHANSPRAGRTLIIANPPSQTGEGFVDQVLNAQGGTLIIQEISEWPLAEQLAILNFLRTRSVVSDGMPMLLNVRIIATASHSLDRRALAGLFNSELLEKLSVFRITMPPLSKRGDEFDDIAMGILGEITRELHKEHLRAFSRDAWAHLREYDWPGNLRELRNVLKMAAITAQGDQIEATDLPDFGHDRVDFHATREQFEKLCRLELLNSGTSPSGMRTEIHVTERKSPATLKDV